MLQLDTYRQALEYRHIIAKADEGVADEKVQIVNMWRIAQIHQDIGVLYGKQGKYAQAMKELEKALEFCRKIADVTADFLPNMVGIHNAIAQNAVFVDINQAIKHSQLAIDLSKTLYDSDGKAYDILYAESLLSKTFVLSEAGSTDIDEIEKISLEAAGIFMKHKEEGSRENIFNLMNVLYKVAGVYRRKLNWDKAREYHLEAIKVSDTLLLSGADVEDQEKETVAHLFFDFGTLSVAFSEGNDFEISIDALQLALELFKAALEQLDTLETLGISAGKLSYADIFDHIALCFEMLKEYDEAKQYYAHAMLLAAAEAKQSEEKR